MATFLSQPLKLLYIAMFYLEHITNFFCRLTSVCRPVIHIYFETCLNKVNINTTKRWNSVELSHRR